jgi:hypothetical protein
MFDQHANEEFEQELFDKWQDAEQETEKLKKFQKELEKKVRIETAINLKSLSIPNDKIANATKLSLEEIENL